MSLFTCRIYRQCSAPPTTHQTPPASARTGADGESCQSVGSTGSLQFAWMLVTLSAILYPVDKTSQNRMCIFKSKPFARFARKNGISDSDLCKAVQDADHGLIGADLGGGVIKQRLARKGSGKSGGFRTLIFFRTGERAIFVHGFAKNEVENIRSDELAALKKLSALMLAYRREEIEKAVASGTLLEVKCDGKSEAVS
jgi:hypothetical protein